MDRLISVDISPVETTAVSDFPAYMAAMKTINIPDGLPRSSARKLADEQLRPVIQVMCPQALGAVVGWDPSSARQSHSPPLPTAGRT